MTMTTERIEFIERAPLTATTGEIRELASDALRLRAEGVSAEKLRLDLGRMAVDLTTAVRERNAALMRAEALRASIAEAFAAPGPVYRSSRPQRPPTAEAGAAARSRLDGLEAEMARAHAWALEILQDVARAAESARDEIKDLRAELAGIRARVSCEGEP